MPGMIKNPLSMSRVYMKPVVTMAASWALFEQSSLPEWTNASERRALRMEYYAGALAFSQALLQPGPSTNPTEQDRQRMLDLIDELIHCSETVQRARPCNRGKEENL
jgi:hypothetical protein